MKLQVLLRNWGIGSRRKSEELIEAGKVEVNGRIAHIGQIVTGEETVRIEGQTIAAPKSSPEKVYLLINKPVGFTSTTADYYDNEQSVLELLPYELKKMTQWQIVGRLDKNSEGLMLLTNNGNVSYVFTHPKFQVQKEYRVTVLRPLSSDEMRKLEGGVRSEAGETYKFTRIELVPGTKVEYKVILMEGKKREIREALGAIGNQVMKLVRVRIGELELGDLASGVYRLLKSEEASRLETFVQRVLNTGAQ